MKAILHCASVEQHERFEYIDDGETAGMLYECVKFNVKSAPWAEDYEKGIVTVYISKPDMLGMFKVGCDYEVDVATTALPKEPKP